MGDCSLKKRKISFAPKLFRDFQSKLGHNKKVSPVKEQSSQELKDSVLSLQQMALKIHSLQNETTIKRKELHALLLQAAETTDKEKLEQINSQASEIRNTLYDNEFLMGNFEHTIEFSKTGGTSHDAFGINAAFERFIEENRAKGQSTIQITATQPTVVETKDDLPEATLDTLGKAGITLSDLSNYFAEALAVLRFVEKKFTFCTPQQLQIWKSVKIGELMLPNYGRICKPLEHFLTDAQLSKQPKKIYKFLGSEGKGGFGQVFHAKNKKTGNDVAIKKLKGTTPHQRRQIANEISFLAFCSHQNLVPFEDIFKINDEEFWIVMDYLNGGTVLQASKKKAFPEPIIATIADQLLLALKYLHSNGIVHRDLKSDNIMLTEYGEVFLVDMGLCVDMEEFNPASNSIAGTFTFMSPESINGDEITPGADIWSLGISLLEMANEGKNIFSNNTLLEMFYVSSKQMKPVDCLLLDPGKWSAQFKNFIELCLDPNVETRKSAEFLLGHQWFAQAISEDSQDDLVNLVRYCWNSEVAPMF